MAFTSLRNFVTLTLGVGLVVLTLGLAGCSAHFCAGSGCNAGTIAFGTSFKQSQKNGNISVVGKKSTFKLGQALAMVANLKAKAGTKTLTLKVVRNGKSNSFPYTVNSPKVNVVGSKFTPTDLTHLGLTQAGKYEFELLRGSKRLAKGSMTEK